MDSEIMTSRPAEKPGLTAGYRRVLRRRYGLLAVIVVAILGSLVLDFVLGPSGLSFNQLATTLIAPDSASAGVRVIVWEIRLPYALMAILVGMALGLAGAEMQTILNNPLASPFTLGVSSAAAFGAALAIILGIGLPGIDAQWFISANAFVFALLAALMLDAITRWTRLPAGRGSPPVAWCCSVSCWFSPSMRWYRCCNLWPVKTPCKGWCSGPWAAWPGPPGTNLRC